MRDAPEGRGTGASACEVAREYVERVAEAARDEGVVVRLDHVDLFEKMTFRRVRGPVAETDEVVLVGAMWVGKTRLIDNLLVNWEV